MSATTQLSDGPRVPPVDGDHCAPTSSHPLVEADSSRRPGAADTEVLTTSDALEQVGEPQVHGGAWGPGTGTAPPPPVLPLAWSL